MYLRKGSGVLVSDALLDETEEDLRWLEQKDKPNLKLISPMIQLNLPDTKEDFDSYKKVYMQVKYQIKPSYIEGSGVS